MARFPMFFNVEDRKCVVFGGGKVALRKIRTLVEFGARVVAVDSHCCPELVEMQEKGLIEIDRGFFMEDLYSSAFMIICATDDEEFNREMVETCKRKKIPVNSATDGEASDFLFPAVTKRGDIEVGVSTSGEAPALSAEIRSMVDELLPQWYEKISGSVEEIREEVFSKTDDEACRNEIMHRIVRSMIDNQGDISPDEVNQTIAKVIQSK